jgi:hypothetical protein
VTEDQSLHVAVELLAVSLVVFAIHLWAVGWTEYLTCHFRLEQPAFIEYTVCVFWALLLAADR